MSVCKDCQREMLDGTGCIFTKFGYKGQTKTYKRIKCNDPEDLHAQFGETDKCHDCGAIAGTYHHDGCDSERCPNCKDQALGCDCEFDLLIK